MATEVLTRRGHEARTMPRKIHGTTERRPPAGTAEKMSSSRTSAPGDSPRVTLPAPHCGPAPPPESLPPPDFAQPLDSSDSERQRSPRLRRPGHPDIEPAPLFHGGLRHPEFHRCGPEMRYFPAGPSPLHPEIGKRIGRTAVSPRTRAAAPHRTGAAAPPTIADDPRKRRGRKRSGRKIRFGKSNGTNSNVEEASAERLRPPKRPRAARSRRAGAIRHWVHHIQLFERDPELTAGKRKPMYDCSTKYGPARIEP